MNIHHSETRKRSDVIVGRCPNSMNEPLTILVKLKEDTDENRDSMLRYFEGHMTSRRKESHGYYLLELNQRNIFWLSWVEGYGHHPWEQPFIEKIYIIHSDDGI